MNDISRQDIIEHLVDDYYAYLGDQTNAELKLILKTSRFTLHEAKADLEKEKK